MGKKTTQPFTEKKDKHIREPQTVLYHIQKNLGDRVGDPTRGDKELQGSYMLYLFTCLLCTSGHTGFYHYGTGERSEKEF